MDPLPTMLKTRGGGQGGALAVVTKHVRNLFQQSIDRRIIRLHECRDHLG